MRLIVSVVGRERLNYHRETAKGKGQRLDWGSSLFSNLNGKCHGGPGEAGGRRVRRKGDCKGRAKESGESRREAGEGSRR